MLRTVYEALTCPRRFLGFLGEGGLVDHSEDGIFVSRAAQDQIQAYLRDLLVAGIDHGRQELIAQEGIGALLALAGKGQDGMKTADYSGAYGPEAVWEGRYAALMTDIEAVRASVKEYMEESDGEGVELGEVVLEWLREVER